MKIMSINSQNNQKMQINQSQPNFGMFKVRGLIGKPKDFLLALSINGNETLTLDHSLKANTFIDKYALSPYFDAGQVEILMTKIKNLAEQGITVFTDKFDTYKIKDSKDSMNTINELLDGSPVLAVESGFNFSPKQDIAKIPASFPACHGCSLNVWK